MNSLASSLSNLNINEKDNQALAALEKVKTTHTDVLKFLHLVVDEVCGKIVVWKEYEDIADVRDIINAYRNVFVQFVSNKWTTKELITENLKKISGVNASFYDFIVEAMSSRLEDLLRCLKDLSSHISQAHLVDFDWKLQLTISSDKISAMREPRLLFNATISENITGKNKDVLIELPKQDLNRLIDTLEQINESVQELRI